MVWAWITSVTDRRMDGQIAVSIETVNIPMLCNTWSFQSQSLGIFGSSHYAVQGRSRSFKVTDFGINRTLVYDFQLIINTNLPSILHRFQELWPIIGQVFAIDMGVPHIKALAGGDPLRISGSTLPLQKLEGLLYQVLKSAQSYIHSSGQNTGV